MLYQRLFPQLANRSWGTVDLDARARIDYPGESRRRTDNPLNDPYVCGQWVEQLHKQLAIEFSFGGYMENRSHLWRGHYQEATRDFVHLGVDYNVPAGTAVAAVRPWIVYDSRVDYEQDGGWGGRVICKHPEAEFYVIYAHLEHGSIVPKETQLKEGQQVGIVGNSDVNGGWFPHLHVQCIAGRIVLSSEGELAFLLDGYAVPLHERFPDPETVL